MDSNELGEFHILTNPFLLKQKGMLLLMGYLLQRVVFQTDASAQEVTQLLNEN